MATPPGTQGLHLLIELRECAAELLDDRTGLEAVLRLSAEAIGAQVVAVAFHQFFPRGVTGFVLLAESHLSIHTWPEQRYAAVDLFSCGNTEPGRAVDLLVRALGARRVETLHVRRGLLDQPSASKLVAGI